MFGDLVRHRCVDGTIEGDLELESDDGLEIARETGFERGALVLRQSCRAHRWWIALGGLCRRDQR